jgi:hypothetical protein
MYDALFLFMRSNIADIFGYNNISGSRPPAATIDRDRIGLSIRLALSEDLTQEDRMDIQTNPKRVNICHILHGEPKNRHAISAGIYADSDQYVNIAIIRPPIFLTQHS